MLVLEVVAETEVGMPKLNIKLKEKKEQLFIVWLMPQKLICSSPCFFRFNLSQENKIFSDITSHA